MYLGEHEGLVDVLGDDSGGEAVGGVVGPGEELFHVVKLEDGLDRAEDLLPCNPHVILNRKDGTNSLVDKIGLVSLAHADNCAKCS